MLIEMGYARNQQTRYTCDRCNIEMMSKERHAIYVQKPLSTAKKRWDLCPTCYAALKRGIEKGKKGV